MNAKTMLLGSANLRLMISSISHFPQYLKITAM
ncbi:hypothetical protein SAMN05444339_105157 [Loktanella atrilutea]|uniref:Uncharacterized protein n=1 Tax=Loktanella atrilutea TaxID=366533 RepID=A0A1M5AYQ4_LOKAT|nr:hypothetical protein SAMN05444339_105157 [Loktanella atrilutea]